MTARCNKKASEQSTRSTVNKYLEQILDVLGLTTLFEILEADMLN